ncbi:MAG TPA: IclR family transcriptional regulator [Symbiobacteriaceae bacterium]|nr:IclR family transcriptional regulator [Symbiobacteriaceae bacterium]
MTEKRTGPSSAADSGQLQTVHRALDLLEAVASQGESSLASLCESLGLARTTTHRLLTTLVTRGYLQQDAASGTYRVGLRSFEVGAAFGTTHQLADLTRPIMREINRQFNESVALAVPDGDEAVYVDVVESTQTLRTFARVGTRVPLYCTGVGKALLMGYGAAELSRYLKSVPLTRHTPTTITTPEAMVAELKQAQTAGYILDREEYHEGVRCGAAPIRDHTGRPVAALSVSGPAYRVVDRHWLTMAGAIGAAARELSRTLGYRG